MQRILDGYYGEFNNNDFNSTFNEKFGRKLLMVGNEINARARESADYLKDIIDRKELDINEKFVKAYKIKDYCNFIFTTNHEVIFKISNTDRRFMLIECPEKRKERDYYDRLIEAIDDEERLKSFFYYLKTRDINGFNTRNVPLTEYKERNIIFNLPAYIKMVYDNPDEFNNNTFSPDELYKKCIQYAKDNKQASNITEMTFFKQFKKVFGCYSRRTNKAFSYTFTGLDKEKVKELVKEKYII